MQVPTPDPTAQANGEMRVRISLRTRDVTKKHAKSVIRPTGADGCCSSLFCLQVSLNSGSLPNPPEASRNFRKVPDTSGDLRGNLRGPGASGETSQNVKNTSKSASQTKQTKTSTTSKHTKVGRNRPKSADVGQSRPKSAKHAQISQRGQLWSLSASLCWGCDHRPCFRICVQGP